MTDTHETHDRATFEQRLLQALTEVDARRPSAPLARQRRTRPRRRTVMIAVAVAVLLAAGSVTAAASGLFKPKQAPLGTKTALHAGETTGVKGMGCQPGSAVTIQLDGRTVLGRTAAETDTSIPGVVGWFRANVTIPANTAPGRHSLIATCPAPDARYGDYIVQHTTAITVD